MEPFIQAIPSGFMFLLALVFLYFALQKFGRRMKPAVLLFSLVYWLVCGFTVGTAYEQITSGIALLSLLAGALVLIAAAFASPSRKKTTIKK